MNRKFEPCMALSQQELDFQLSPSQSAKDAMGVLDQLAHETAAAIADRALLTRSDISYGPRPRERLDVFRPAAAQSTALPCLIFLHGGFWQEGDKTVSGFAAKTFVELGWIYVSVGYTLTPEVSLTELVQEIDAAVRYVHTHAADLGIDPHRMILSGHSAGGHLAACILADVLDTGTHQRISGAVLISGVFELAPIAKSYVNDLTRISAPEIQRLSPLRYAPAASIPTHVLIGADEPAAFQIQSSVLRDEWTASLPRLTCHVAAGRDHFDVLEELNDQSSQTVQAILDMA